MTKLSTMRRYRDMSDCVRSGTSIEQVAVDFDVSTRTIREAMKHCDVSLTERGRPLVILAEIYRAMPTTGRKLTRSLADISRTTHVSRERVRQVFSEAKNLGLLKSNLTTVG